MSFNDWNIHSLKAANPSGARQLAQRNLRSGNAVMYTFNTTFGPTVVQIVQFNAKHLGLDVEIKQFDRAAREGGRRGAPFDIGLEGWGADYPDPANFGNVLLLGDDNIRAANNQNVAYFSDPSFNKRMKQAALMAGEQRYRTYGAGTLLNVSAFSTTDA